MIVGLSKPNQPFLKFEISGFIQASELGPVYLVMLCLVLAQHGMAQRALHPLFFVSCICMLVGPRTIDIFNVSFFNFNMLYIFIRILKLVTSLNITHPL